MVLIHGSYSDLHLIVIGLWFALAFKFAAVTVPEMDRLLGEAVEKALIDCRITVPDAADKMRINESQFRKALRGEGYRLLALNHLVKLGPEFMVHLTASLMWLTAKQRASEILATVQDVRRGV